MDQTFKENESRRFRKALYARGIRAQEMRGSALSRSWWARQWRANVEAMGVGSRYGKGRNYAADGQVLELKIAFSHVEGIILGSRPTPYTVTLDFRAPEGKARERLIALLREEPITAARLLADDLPTRVEEIFRSEGFTLFPGGKLGPGKYDMTCQCSCPDWANPCKHVTALLVLLGEEVARRPATLLELRGIAVEELI